MAGPSAGILLANARAGSHQVEVERLIRLVSSRHDGDHMDVVTTLPVGGSYAGTGRPFLVNLDDPPLWCEHADFNIPSGFYETEFGVHVRAEISLCAMCNQPEDHRILADLSIAISERNNGVINLGGLIVPDGMLPPPPDLRKLSWREIEPRLQVFTDSMPGKAIAVPYSRADGREWALHMVDAAFLRAWLAHPQFHMIK